MNALAIGFYLVLLFGGGLVKHVLDSWGLW